MFMFPFHPVLICTLFTYWNNTHIHNAFFLAASVDYICADCRISMDRKCNKDEEAQTLF